MNIMKYLLIFMEFSLKKLFKPVIVTKRSKFKNTTDENIVQNAQFFHTLTNESVKLHNFFISLLVYFCLWKKPNHRRFQPFFFWLKILIHNLLKSYGVHRYKFGLKIINKILQRKITHVFLKSGIQVLP